MKRSSYRLDAVIIAVYYRDALRFCSLMRACFGASLFFGLSFDRIYGINMDNKNLTTEKKLELIREISTLADGVTLEYVAGLSQIVNDPEADEAQKRKAYGG